MMKCFLLYTTIAAALLSSPFLVDVVDACPYLQAQQKDASASSSQHTAPRKLVPAAVPVQQHRRQLFLDDFLGGIWQWIVNLFRALFGISDDVQTKTPSASPTAAPTREGNSGNPDDGEAIMAVISSAKEDIKNLIFDGNHGTPKFVRLAFHDCVGGCNGCVDLENPENFGLAEPLQALEDSIVGKYAATLTRGDIVALAGLTAAEVAQTSNGGNVPANKNPISFPMNWVGRPSCDDPTGGPNVAMPSAHLATQELLDFFATQFGFTQRDTVAIMGAHSLGKASPPNSGFDGLDGWTTNRIRLDNEFYTVLLNDNAIDPSFEQEITTNQGRPFPDQFFWRRTKNIDGQFGPNENFGQFMLNADMALVTDLTGFLASDGTGQASCQISGSTGGGAATICPASPLLPVVQEYAASNEDWILDFRTAFTKMLSTGCDSTTCTAVQ